MQPEGYDSDYLEQRGPAFCHSCGGAMRLGAHPGETRPRHACASCGRIHYLNPLLVAAVIPEYDGKVLLLRRARPPRAGAWVFPGGFVEYGETAEEAAQREAEEEAGIAVQPGSVLGVYSRRGPGVIMVVYRGSVESSVFTPGEEATEAAWFTPDAIPWDDLAFDTTAAALRDWAAMSDE